MAPVCKSAVALALLAAVAAERSQEHLLLQMSHYTGGQLSAASRQLEKQDTQAGTPVCRAAAERPELSDSACDAACQVLPQGMWPCDESGVCTCTGTTPTTTTPSGPSPGSCQAASGLESVVSDDDCATACALLPMGAWPCDDTGVCKCSM
eukprot:TRINITY_DN475_c0_g2_i1.p1 TRINITY_DN475_c0_g2~~TRINITY_DN475_c0_g2_i1.p1  ORF type:complete len:171 (-),score=23.47 TRINITY_DN475_c0_g2_i1:252-704(-)